MRPCPGCDYIVPEAWSACKRCGTELPAPGAEPVLATVASRVMSTSPYRPPTAHVSATSSATRPPNGAHSHMPAGHGPSLAHTPVAPPAPPRPAPVAAFHAAPPPVVADLRPSERGRGRRVHPGGDAPAKRGGGLLSSMGLLLAVVVAGTCGYLGWYKLAHPPVPAELKPWLEQGQGVTYAPAGAGLSVSLPASPVEQGTTVTVGHGTMLGARLAESTVGDHIVGVAWLSAPQSSLTDDADGPTHAAAVMASQAVGFSLDVPQSASYHGLGAITAEISRSGLDGDAFVVLDGTRIVVVYVLGTTHGTAGFDHLRHSLQLS